MLTEANPWWRAAAGHTDPTAWTASHRLLRDRARHDRGYRPTILDDIATGPIGDHLTVLTGPRRVGKSVVLLDTVAVLCARPDVSPWQIIHLPCDGLTVRDLRRALTLGRELTRPADAQALRPRIWLFDEIGAITGWTSALKAARDGTAAGDDTMVVTGSRWAMSEDLEGNLMAGRAGTGIGRRWRLLLPMSFRDYLAAARPELPRPDVLAAYALQDHDALTTLEQLRFDVDAFDLAWQAYLTSGEFPRAVAEYEVDGQVSEAYLRDLTAWLRRDVDPEAPPESIPLLLDGLAHRSTSPLNLSSAAEDLGYTRSVFDARLKRLVSAAAALPCRPLDDAGRPVQRGQSKIYLTDPLLSWLPSRLRLGLPVPDMTRLSEAALGVHLARAVETATEGRWMTGDTIGFARTSAGHEVDFAPVSLATMSGTQMTTPLEGKWVDDGWRGEARTIVGRYDRGILATKSVLDTDGSVWAVPAPILAMLLI